MIDVKLLRQDPAGVRAALLRREDDALGPAIDAALDLDRRWRDLVTETERLKAGRNAATASAAARPVQSIRQPLEKAS